VGFREDEKDHFVSLLREYEPFCEVQVLTYCVMPNHFHVLLEESAPPEVLPTLDEVLAKMRRLTGFQDPEGVQARYEQLQAAGDAAGTAAYLAGIQRRMWDLSLFMAPVKQRFTQWYNGKHGRMGTLWDSRFRSVLVEGTGEALPIMAGYIDLNPVRAGLVSDPKDYRWSGYGEAMQGRRRAREGLRKVMAAWRGEQMSSPTAALEAYGRLINGEEDGSEAASGQGKHRRLGSAARRRESLRMLRENGRLPLAEYLRCRVRYFSDGTVFGSGEFAEKVFVLNRTKFGPRRKTGARRVRGLEGFKLFTVRDLRVGLFS